MKKLTGKDVALSGVSAALAILFIVGAIYIPFATISFYVLSALAISLPLIKRNILSSILSYVAAALIAFFVGSIKMLPFVMFFGLYAIIQWLLDVYFCEKFELKTWIKIAINVAVKIVYFALVFWGLFVFMNLTVADFNILNINWNMPLLVFVCFIIFVLYDIVYREIFKLFKKILEKRI